MVVNPKTIKQKGFSMKKRWASWLMVGVAVSVSAYGSDMKSSADLPPGHPPLDAAAGYDSMSHNGEPLVAGEILETMDTGNYTYILIQTPDKEVWAAAEQFDAVVGSRVAIPKGMLVKNFESPTLNRTFDEVYFADSVEVLAPGAAIEPKPEASPAKGDGEVITQPENGITVTEINQRRRELAGQTVTVRGRVTKYTERVMGQNWLHISDGSGEGKENDLTVSTPDVARKGDLVTVTGPVVIDEDLGSGYFYDVMIKSGSVVQE